LGVFWVNFLQGPRQVDPNYYDQVIKAQQQTAARWVINFCSRFTNFSII